MRPRLGFLAAFALAAVTVFAANAAHASQLDFEGLSRTLNTGGTVCAGVDGVYQNLAIAGERWQYDLSKFSYPAPA